MKRARAYRVASPAPAAWTRRASQLGIAALALQLAACAGVGPAPTGAAATPSSPAAARDPALEPALAVFAHHQRQAAEDAEREGRWADAARAWEVVTLVTPGDAEAMSRWTALRARIDDGVKDMLRRAAEARRRGDLDGAQRWGLQALALRPDDEEATALVRTLEAERNRRAALARRALPAPPSTPDAGMGAVAGTAGGGHGEEAPVRGRAGSPGWGPRPAR